MLRNGGRRRSAAWWFWSVCSLSHVYGVYVPNCRVPLGESCTVSCREPSTDAGPPDPAVCLESERHTSPKHPDSAAFLSLDRETLDLTLVLRNWTGDRTGDYICVFNRSLARVTVRTLETTTVSDRSRSAPPPSTTVVTTGLSRSTRTVDDRAKSGDRHGAASTVSFPVEWTGGLVALLSVLSVVGLALCQRFRHRHSRPR